MDTSRLTGREIEVLPVVVLGRSNMEIAEELSISLGTVKSHVSSLLTKLQLRRRSHAVALFVAVGELQLEVKHA